MIHLHCWHEDKSTRRKIRVPQRCQSDNPSYLRSGDMVVILNLNLLMNVAYAIKNESLVDKQIIQLD